MSRLLYLPAGYLAGFEAYAGDRPEACFSRLRDAGMTIEDFRHYFTAAAVASSQIEGSSLDLNSFLNARNTQPEHKEVTEIEHLIEAYQYARRNPLTYDGLLKCHAMLAASFTHMSNRMKGRVREQQVGIRSWHGLVYLAVEPEHVAAELKKLFQDIDIVQEQDLSLKQALYYAAWVHFLFVKIHPFVDGNGRAARLLEKWLLAALLGPAAWSIPAEKYYWDKRSIYYERLNVGVNYYETLERLERAQPFTYMLAEACCYEPLTG